MLATCDPVNVTLTLQLGGVLAVIAGSFFGGKIYGQRDTAKKSERKQRATD